ncbi:unnamed protein product, partial [Mesorhabditis spiculigera]
MRPSHSLAVILVSLALWVGNANADDDNPITSRFKCRSNGCCDHHEWCRFWASVGECRTNAEWMEDNCQLACGTCRKKLPQILRQLINARAPHKELLTSARPNPVRPPPRPPVTRPPTRLTRPTLRPTFTAARTFFTRPPVTRARVTPAATFRTRVTAAPTSVFDLATPSTEATTIRVITVPKGGFGATLLPRGFQFGAEARKRPFFPFFMPFPGKTSQRLPVPTRSPLLDRAFSPQPVTRPAFPAPPPVPVISANPGQNLSPPPPFNERSTAAQNARCLQLMRNPPENLAEIMHRERLMQPVEDQSGRRPIDLDQVVRSNLANACVPRNDEAECERSACYHLTFRTFDGTCNNIRNPLQGSAYRPYTRLLPPNYDDGLHEPVGSLFPESRPNPRMVTRNIVSSDEQVLSHEFNALLMQFGQFVSHDMAKTTLVPSSKCNVCQNMTSRCMAVKVMPDDPNPSFRHDTCIRVSRSSPICGSGHFKPRQQLNENSNYIDASPIYGSSLVDSKKFRDGRTGRLQLPMFNGMQMLPFDTGSCRGPRSSCKVIFRAGDSRVNLFVGLSSWHTVFTREHNRIAATLQRLNPHWSGDRVFMESRKLVGAQVQAIVYREYLPKILGTAFATTVGEYFGYDPSVDSTIANEFTSGAFRFGHGMIQELYQRLDANFRNMSIGPLALEHGTLKSDTLIFEGGPEAMIRGMLTQPVKRPQRVTPAVTEKMFGSTDLATINIQRGRDHGHQPYIKYRELCGMGSATTFEQLGREILSTGVRNRLRNSYGSVDRIDLWVGALVEDPVLRGLVGPTIACIVGPQFKRTRDGDRLYYENPGVFTRAQVNEIRRSSLSRILCDNARGLTMVPREAFRLGPFVPCGQIPAMDLSKWKE